MVDFRRNAGDIGQKANFKKDRTGCNNTIGTNEYLTLRDIQPDFVEPFVSAVSVIPVEEKVLIPEMPNEQENESMRESVIKAKLGEEIKIDVIEKPVAKTPVNNDPNENGFKGYDLMELSRNVIFCLSHISENYYFGISVLISVLRGGNRKQIVKHKLNEVPEYGMYSNMNCDDMRAIVQWMIDNHYMLKTKAKYPVLHPTYNGNHFDECITMKQLKDLKKYLEDPNREVFDEDDSEE